MMALKVSIIKSLFFSVISIKINAGEDPMKARVFPGFNFSLGVCCCMDQKQ